jgi:hypothetical protein
LLDDGKGVLESKDISEEDKESVEESEEEDTLEEEEEEDDAPASALESELGVNFQRGSRGIQTFWRHIGAGSASCHDMHVCIN